jgi:hypothetical protein
MSDTLVPCQLFEDRFEEFSAHCEKYDCDLQELSRYCDFTYAQRTAENSPVFTEGMIKEAFSRFDLTNRAGGFFGLEGRVYPYELISDRTLKIIVKPEINGCEHIIFFPRKGARTSMTTMTTTGINPLWNMVSNNMYAAGLAGHGSEMSMMTVGGPLGQQFPQEVHPAGTIQGLRMRLDALQREKERLVNEVEHHRKVANSVEDAAKYWRDEARKLESTAKRVHLKHLILL